MVYFVKNFTIYCANDGLLFLNGYMCTAYITRRICSTVIGKVLWYKCV